MSDTIRIVVYSEWLGDLESNLCTKCSSNLCQGCWDAGAAVTPQHPPTQVRMTDNYGLPVGRVISVEKVMGGTDNPGEPSIAVVIGYMVTIEVDLKEIDGSRWARHSVATAQ